MEPYLPLKDMAYYKFKDDREKAIINKIVERFINVEKLELEIGDIKHEIDLLNKGVRISEDGDLIDSKLLNRFLGDK